MIVHLAIAWWDAWDFIRTNQLFISYAWQCTPDAKDPVLDAHVWYPVHCSSWLSSMLYLCCAKQPELRLLCCICRCTASQVSIFMVLLLWTKKKKVTHTHLVGLSPDSYFFLEYFWLNSKPRIYSDLRFLLGCIDSGVGYVLCISWSIVSLFHHHLIFDKAAILCNLMGIRIRIFKIWLYLACILFCVSTVNLHFLKIV